MTSLEQEFERDMLKPLPGETTASDTIRSLVRVHGGVGAAKVLLKSSSIKTLEWLERRGQLEYSMEAIVVQPKYESLFTREEIAIARTRLQRFGFRFDSEISASRYVRPTLLQLYERIQQGEDDTLEFKVAALWNARTGKRDDTMKDNVLQAVVAFLNSYGGGDVILGVENETNAVIGLEQDFALAEPAKKSRDGYVLWIRNIIADNLGARVTSFYQTFLYPMAGKEILLIHVLPANEPIYLKKEFYVRDGNRKLKMSMPEAVSYIMRRWGT